MGFLKKYFSSWVLKHVIRVIDAPTISKHGKLYEIWVIVKLEDDAQCDLPNGIYIWHDSLFLLHWTCVHASRLMSTFGPLSLWTTYIAWIWLGLSLVSLESIERVLTHLKDVVPLLLEDVPLLLGSLHPLGEDMPPFEDDVALGRLNVAPFGENISLWSPYTCLLDIIWDSRPLLGDHVPHMWLWTCIYGRCYSICTLLLHFENNVEGLLTRPLLCHGYFMYYGLIFRDCNGINAYLYCFNEKGARCLI